MDLLSPQSQLIFHDPAALDPTDRMLDPHSNTIDATISVLLFICQPSSTRLFLWLQNHDAVDVKALKSHILIQGTSWWKMIAFTISCPFIMTRSFPGFSQTPHATMLINNDDVLDCVIFLLAAVIPFLFFWVTWSIYRSFCSVMDKKGRGCSVSPPLNEDVPLPLAPSSFVEELTSANAMRMSRCGISPVCANARLRTGCSRWIHILAFDWRMPNKLPWTSCVGACLR